MGSRDLPIARSNCLGSNDSGHNSAYPILITKVGIRPTQSPAIAIQSSQPPSHEPPERPTKPYHLPQQISPSPSLQSRPTPSTFTFSLPLHQHPHQQSKVEASLRPLKQPPSQRLHIRPRPRILLHNPPQMLQLLPRNIRVSMYYLLRRGGVLQRT